MFIGYSENQKLFLRPYDFNRCRIMQALAEVVENNGGKVKPGKSVFVVDRALENVEPVKVFYTSYITFIFDGIAYYLQTEDNPFFPARYIKTPVRNGKYSKDACLEELETVWLYDCVFSSNVPESDIKEIANILFNGLVKSPKTEIIRDWSYCVVPNTYDGGSHEEKVLKPERMAVIDW